MRVLVVWPFSYSQYYIEADFGRDETGRWTRTAELYTLYPSSVWSIDNGEAIVAETWNIERFNC